MKGKLSKRLMAVAMAAISALTLTFGTRSNLTAHAELAEYHYSKTADMMYIDNEHVMKTFGRNEALYRCSGFKDNITFYSDDCTTNGQLLPENRNFVIAKGKQFKITISSDYRIRAIEFGDDISGSCSCNDTSYKKQHGDENYFLFENYDAPSFSLTFTADKKEGFSFEDIIVHYVRKCDPSGEKEVSAYVNTPKTFTLAKVGNLSVDNNQIVSASYDDGKLEIMPLKVGETDVYMEYKADINTAKGVMHYHIKVNKAKYTRCLVKDGKTTEYVSYLSNVSDEIEDFPPIDGYYWRPVWYYRKDTGDDLHLLTDKSVANGYILYAYYYPIQHFDTKPASCTESGIKEYWYADSRSDSEPMTRGLYCFEDEACTKPISQSAWERTTGVIPATGHKLKKTDALAPTCTTNGHEAFWYCDNCKKYFSDEACKNEITYISAWKTQKPATGHSYKDGICENCGAFEDGIGARLAGVSVSLDGSIGVNFYMQLAENIVADENAYLLVTYPNGSNEKMAVRDVQPITMNGKSYYIFQCKVAATEMTDTIKAQIITGSGDGTEYSYSVKEYADYLLAHTEDNAEYAEAEELVRAMLNYGAYAQTYKGHNADTLPCDPMDMTSYNINEHDFSADSSDHVSLMGANLSMLSKTTLRLFFEADDINGVTIMNGAEELAIGVDNGFYFVEIKNISPDKLSNDFTLTVHDNGTEFCVIYSPMTYCYQASQISNNEALVNLVKAIAKYNDAAKAYFKEAK